MSETENNAKDDGKRSLYGAIAVSLYRLEADGENPKAAAEKKEEYKEKRAEYVKKARRLVRLLESRGVSLAVAETAEEEA